MSRIRTIKPEFWASEQVMECSPLARLAFIGMWNFCDDQGVHPASAKTLKAEVFPADDISAAEVAALVDELLKNDLLREFHENGKTYWHVTGWHHQLIKNPSAPKYPSPHQGGTTQAIPQHYPSPTPALPPVREGKGGEGKGKELKGREEEETSTISARESCATENPSSSPSSNVLDSSRESRTEEAGRFLQPAVLLEVWNHVNPERPIRALPPKRKQSVGTTLAFVAGNLGKPDWPKSPDDIPAWFADLFRYARDHDGYLRDRDFGFFMDADRLSGAVEGGYEPRH